MRLHVDTFNAGRCTCDVIRLKTTVLAVLRVPPDDDCTSIEMAPTTLTRFRWVFERKFDAFSSVYWVRCTVCAKLAASVDLAAAP